MKLYQSHKESCLPHTPPQKTVIIEVKNCEKNPFQVQNWNARKSSAIDNSILLTIQLFNWKLKWKTIFSTPANSKILDFARKSSKWRHSELKLRGNSIKFLCHSEKSILREKYCGKSFGENIVLFQAEWQIYRWKIF